MYRKQRARILKDYAKSPRCVTDRSVLSKKVSWKNLLKADVDEKYRILKKSELITSDDPEEFKEPIRTSRLTFSRVSMGINTSRVSPKTSASGFFQTQALSSEKWSKHKLQAMTRSEFFEQSTVPSSLNQLTNEHRSDDLYHQKLREEERIYLLKKFMEHVEKTHLIPL